MTLYAATSSSAMQDKGLVVLSSLVKSSPKSSAMADFFWAGDDTAEASDAAAEGELATWASLVDPES